MENKAACCLQQQAVWVGVIAMVLVVDGIVDDDDAGQAEGCDAEQDVAGVDAKQGGGWWRRSVRPWECRV